MLSKYCRKCYVCTWWICFWLGDTCISPQIPTLIYPVRKGLIYRLVSHGGFFRVEKFTDLLVFVNYVYNWKIWRHISDVFKQFYCSCGYVPIANDKGMYTKLWTEDDSEWASKCRYILGSNHLGRVFLVLESKSFPVSLEVAITVHLL